MTELAGAAPSPLPPLFPVPRTVRPGDGAGRCSAPLRVVADPSLPAQGYRLVVRDDDAVLAHADPAGRRYGEAAVAQLRSADGTLPVVEVDDHPDVAVRGYMLDVSRDRVPTRASLERVVALLALARFNHLQLYVEHTFAYRDHPTVWRDASPLTPEDLQWLDARCRAAGIELAGNQNCFGHMERWLRHDRYRARAECPDGWQGFGATVAPPTVLAPTADNAAFALDLVREQMAHLTGRTVNIGCDETFELGRGASADDVARRGLGAVYVEHLTRLIGPLAAEGYDVQFWGDVARAHPHLIGALPPATALAWSYEAPGAVDRLPPKVLDAVREAGIDLAAHADFATNAAPFAATGRPFWLAAGTSAWNSLVGRLDNATANLLDAAEQAVALGAGGILVTDWGDNGHLQPPSVSDAPVLYGGAVAWCATTNRDLDLAGVLDRWVTRDPTGRTGRAVVALGRLWAATGMVAFNSSPLQAALCPHQRHLVVGRPDVDAVRAVVDAVEGAVSELSAARPEAPDGEVLRDELTTAAGLARHGALRMLARAGATAGVPAQRELRAELQRLLEDHRRCWLARSRPGGLDDSSAHLEATLHRYGD